MQEALFFNNKKYISAKRAGELTGYTSDYIGQLCRGGKIESQLIGKTRYVCEQEILDYKKNFESNSKNSFSKASKKVFSSYVSRKKEVREKILGKVADPLPVQKIIEEKIEEMVTEPVAAVAAPSEAPVKSWQSEIGYSIKYIKDKSALFPNLNKTLDTRRLKHSALSVVETQVYLGRKNGSAFEKWLINVSVAVATLFILGSAFDVPVTASRLSGFMSDMNEEVSLVASPVTSRIPNLGVGGEVMLASVFMPSDLGSLPINFYRYINDAIYKVAKPWVGESPVITVVQNKIETKKAEKVADTYQPQARTVIAPGVSKGYVDSRYEELKNYLDTRFLGVSSVPTVVRQYVTKQSDSIVNTLSAPIRELSGVTITDSTFSGSNINGDSASFASLSVSNTTTVTTLLGNYFSVGSTTPGYALTINGSGYFDGGTVTAANLAATSTANLNSLTISGNGSGITFTGSGNHDISASSGTLRLGSNVVIGNIEALDNTIDIGTPGVRFDKIYADEVNASTIVGTLTGGNLTADTFNINSDNATADTENSYLSFERGTVVPNALLTWNAAAKKFEFNQSLFVQSSDNVAASSTLEVRAHSNQATSTFIVSNSSGSSMFNVNYNGNVGIGTSTPSSDSIVDIWASGGALSCGHLGLRDTANGNYVCMGPDSRGSYLEYGAVNTGYGFLNIFTHTGGASATLNSNVRSSNPGSIILAAGNLTGGDIIFQTATTTERMRIKNNGNVGIGTSSPVSSLHIQNPAGSPINTNAITIASSSGQTLVTIGTNSVGNGSISLRSTQGTAGGGINGYRMSAGSVDVILIGGTGCSGGVGSFLCPLMVNQNSSMSYNWTASSDPGAQVGFGSYGGGGAAGDTLALYDIATAQVGNGANLVFNANRTTGGITDIAKIGTSVTNIGNTTATGDLLFSTIKNTSLSEKMRITGGGFVGIGTSTPFAQLQISSTTASATFKPQLALSDQSAATDSKHWTLSSQGGNFYIASSTDLYATTTGTSALTIIGSNGNMGIGTTTPTNKLTITDSSASQLTLSAGAGINQWAFRNAGGNFYLSTTTIAGTATTSTSALEIAGDGFGTTTVRGLNISGQATSTSNVGFNLTGGCYGVNGSCLSASYFGALTTYDAWTHPSYGGSATTSLLTLSGGFVSQASSTIVGQTNLMGNVGIGSSTPSAKLAVVGNISNVFSASSGAGVIGSVNLGTSPRTIVVQGKYAYVANETSSTFSIVDISNPASPTVISSTAVTSLSTASENYAGSDIAVAGSHLYAASSNGFVYVFDISNPKAPSQVGSVSLGSEINSVTVNGQFAYIGTASGKFHVVDISNPASPKLISSTADLGGRVIGSYISGRYAYIATRATSGLFVYDISNPFAPTQVANNAVSGAMNGMIVGNGHYIVINDIIASTGRVIDITDPRNPTQLAALSGTITHKFIAGKYLYAMNSLNIRVYDMTSPDSPVLVHTLPLGNAVGIAVSGKYLYTSTTGNTLSVVDLTGIETTSMIAHSAEVGSLTVRNNASFDGGLQVQDFLNVGLGGLLTRGALTVQSTTSPSFFIGKLSIGTTTPYYSLTVASTTGPQFALSDQAGIAQWAFRNAGGNFYLSTTTVAGTATTSISAFEVSGSGFGTTTVRGLNISGQATTTSNVGMNITTGCYAVNGVCISGGAGGSGDITAVGSMTTGDAFADSTADDDWLGLGGSAGRIEFDDQSVDEVNILSARMGIATTTPNATLALQGTAGAYMFMIASSTGTPILTVDEYGNFSQKVTGTAAFSVQMASGTPVFEVDTSSSHTNAGLDITAATGQTANLLNFYSSGGTFLSGFTASGGLFMNTSSSTAVNIYDGSGNAAFVVSSSGKSAGVGTSTLAYAFTVQDDQATNYVARIDNKNTGTDADGLLITLGVANASRTTSNYFIGFATGDKTVAGKIQGGASAVAYTTTAADLAEYFRASDINDMPLPGEIVALDKKAEKTVRRASSTEASAGQGGSGVEPLGIVSTNPGFIGNGPICRESDMDCDKNYAKYNSLVAIAGQVPVRISEENGPIQIGDYLTLSSTTPGAATKLVESGYIVGVVISNATTTTFGSTTAQTVNVFIKSGWREVETEGSKGKFASVINYIKDLGIEFGQNFVKITNLITNKLTADKVETKELCIEGVCVTKDQLQALVNMSGVNTVVGDGDADEEPATTTPVVVPPDTSTSTSTATSTTATTTSPVVEEVPAETPATTTPEVVEEVVEPAVEIATSTESN